MVNVEISNDKELKKLAAEHVSKTSLQKDVSSVRECFDTIALL